MQAVLSNKTTQLLAFFLPQYYPIPENDEWWGKGFTEWTNVTRGRPLFRGHYQPHLPADLGFYDLRVPEVREQQAALADGAGLSGFIYFHYWFNGRQLLDRPFTEVLRLRKPDFPFCLCWANEPWCRNWDGQGRDILLDQTHSAADDLAHIRWLLRAFDDDRYIKIDGRPLFLIYRPSQLADMRQTAALWRAQAQEHGFPDLFLGAVRAFAPEFSDPAQYGLDAAVEFKPNGTDCGESLRSEDPLEIGYRLHRVWDYDAMVQYALKQSLPSYKIFPGVCPSWDNSVRRREGGMIFRDSTPEKFGAWLQEILVREALRPQKESIVIVNAWNEWAEGNHLEPCQRWGRAYLDATQKAIATAGQITRPLRQYQIGQTLHPAPNYRLTGFVDGCLPTPTGLAVDGWCVDAETQEPPDLLAFGVAQPDGSYLLLSVIENQRLARPDVAQHLNNPRALLSGWRGHYSLAAGNPARADAAILGIRARDNAAAVLAGLG
jgi:lipopolysaccharide biosynthesis protein